MCVMLTQEHWKCILLLNIDVDHPIMPKLQAVPSMSVHTSVVACTLLWGRCQTIIDVVPVVPVFVLNDPEVQVVCKDDHTIDVGPVQNNMWTHVLAPSTRLLWEVTVEMWSCIDKGHSLLWLSVYYSFSANESFDNSQFNSLTFCCACYIRKTSVC